MNKYKEALYKLIKHIDFPDSPQRAFDPSKDEPRKYYIILQKLVDKATPKKPIREKLEDATKTNKHSLVNLVGNRYYNCPSCGSYLGAFLDNYCKYCGQALRSDE